MDSPDPPLDWIQAIRDEIADLREWLDLYTAFADRMDALRSYTAETGYDTWLVRQNGWQTLYTETAQVRRCCMALLKTGMLVLPEAPMHSVDILRFVPVHCSLRTAAAGLYLLRYLITLAAAGAVLLISRFSKNPQAALLTALSVLLLPAALAELGLPVPDPVHWLALSVQ